MADHSKKSEKIQANEVHKYLLFDQILRLDRNIAQL